MTDIRETLLGRIGDGWLKSIECSTGWDRLLADLDRDLAAIDPDYTIAQVKEKFGTLRFYAQTATKSDAFQMRIAEAEKLSATVCEWCGAPGETQAQGGWWVTLCSTCLQARAEKRKRMWSEVE